MNEVDSTKDICPLCENELPTVLYLWYCSICKTLTKQGIIENKIRWHRTTYGRCLKPMILSRVAISCPHNYSDEIEDMEILNTYEKPFPDRMDLFPTETERTRLKRAKKKLRPIEQEAQNERVRALGLTPVDPRNYEG